MQALVAAPAPVCSVGGATHWTPNRSAPRLITRADALDFAWALAAAAFPALPRRQRSWLCVALGTGDDQQEAIEELLRLVADHQVTLPAELTGIATDWVNGYAGTAQESRLRVLVAQAMPTLPQV